MGEVYRAKDTRLGRDVAVKVLPAAWSADPQRRARFEREARAIAALNHPNICTVHDVGQDGDTTFLVMELIEGEPLSTRLEQGPLPIDVALARAIEIADALDAAHRQGIIHRDLKPGNVMLAQRAAAGTSEGAHAKLLDFGLARFPTSGAPGAATDTHSFTEAGTVLGTPQYMAPEQVEGRQADARTDVFAFGALLYEMLTGKHAFDGSSSAAIMAAILRADAPSPTSVLPAVPPALDRLVRTCLAKDPEERFASMHDVALELRWIASSADATFLHNRGGPHVRVHLFWAGAALLLAIAGAIVGARFFRAASDTGTPVVTPADQARLVVLPFENLTRRADEDWLAGAFSDSVSAGLQPIASLILVPRERVLELYSAESRPESAPLNGDLARQLSQRLRVRYYVHGSYQRVGNDVRIVARLVDVTRDAIQAQETLTGPFADVLKLEETLAGRLATRLTPEGRPPAGGLRPETSNLEAYRLVTEARGMYALSRFGEAAARLETATELDPGYALAWALRAKTNARLLAPAAILGRPGAAAVDAVLDQARTAARLDPLAVESHLALALAYRGLHDRARWREAAVRAAALDPRNGEAHILLGDVLSVSPGFGCPTDPQPAAAETEYREGIRIDPLMAPFYVNLVTHHWWMGRRVEALHVLEQGLAVQPGNVLANSAHPFNLLFADRPDDAAALLDRRVSSGATLTPLDDVTFGYLALKRRRFDEAAARFRRPETARALSDLSLTLITAVAHFEAGRAEDGAMYLARGIAADPECAAWARQVPAFAPFRDEPAFVRAVGGQSVSRR